MELAVVVLAPYSSDLVVADFANNLKPLDSYVFSTNLIKQSLLV
jgi:hypothetical protein